MKWSRARLEQMAADGDERAAAFLAAVGAKKSPAARLLDAVASIDPDKVERQERKNLGNIKRRLMKHRGEACQVCDATMPDKSLIHAHHIFPVAEGGTDDDRNIVLLCPNCHAIAHWRYRQTGSSPRTALEFFSLLNGAPTVVAA